MVQVFRNKKMWWLVFVVVSIMFGVWGVAFGINKFVFAGALPFNTDPAKLSSFRNIGSVENIDKLLLAERIFANRLFWNPEILGMKRSDKVLHGDVMYVYDDVNKLYRVNKQKRPMEIVSLSKVEISGRPGYILGERVKNRNGSVSFLHFGYIDTWHSDVEMIKKVMKRFETPSYVVPMAGIKDCDGSRMYDELCERTDWGKVGSLINQWVETGNVPKELETIILIPREQVW